MSIEQVELESIMEVSVTGQVLKCARQMNLSGGLSLCKAIGWNMRSQSRLLVARPLREKTPPSMLVVTIRSEEREICRATLRELLRIVKDQIEERSVVVIVLSNESTIWREASMRTLAHDAQLKYVDVGEMGVITNSRCIAEQIMKDRVKKVAMDGPKVVENDVLDGPNVVENVVMDGLKLESV